MIDAAFYRKSGKVKVDVEVDKELDAKLMSMAPKNFKERKRV